VFELAQQDGDIEQWGRRLARIRELFADPKVAAVLTNPTIPASRRDGLVATAPHLFDDAGTNLARLLIESGRVGEAAAIEEDFDTSLVSVDVGRIVAVGDGIAQIYGLQNAMAGELLEFPHDTFGLALNLEEDQVRSVILGDFGHLHEGDEVRTTGRLLEVPVGDELLGRIVNPLGVPLDDKGPIKTNKTLPVEKIAPGVITRQRVDSPVQTGIK